MFLCISNCPQYCSSEIKNFAAAHGFTHITSSPGFAQSNGEAEHHVQTVKKNLLKKTENPCLALLADRATPLAIGYSPAQLLMGRWQRTPVPQQPTLLTSVLPDRIVVTAKETKKREKDPTRFNKRHCWEISVNSPKVNQRGIQTHSPEVQWFPPTQLNSQTLCTTLQVLIGEIDTILSLFQTLFHHRHQAHHHNQVSLWWVLQNAQNHIHTRVSRYTHQSNTHQPTIHGHTTRSGRGVKTKKNCTDWTYKQQEKKRKCKKKRCCCFMFCCLRYLPPKNSPDCIYLLFYLRSIRSAIFHFESLDVLQENSKFLIRNRKLT